MVENSSRPRWPLWLMMGLGVAGLLYSALGITMVASLAPDPPGHQWLVLDYAYLAGFGVSLVLVICGGVVLIRRRRRNASNPGSAAV